MKRLVSIIIPAYNAEVYIERTLRSASQQTYDDIEIIVIDDGSTDRTREIAERFAVVEQRMKVISVPNGGVARARNIGLSTARGAFVAFLDADDLWHPTKIDRQLACLDAMEPDYAACYALHRIIDAHDKIINSADREPAEGYILARHLYGRFVGNGSSLLVRTHVAKEIGGFDPSYADANIGGCEDLDFELKVAAHYRMVGVSSYLVGYRRYDGNMSSNRQRMILSMIETTKRHLRANPVLPSYARKLAKSTSYSYYFWCMMTNRSPVKALGWLLRLAVVDFLRAFVECSLALKSIGRNLRRSATKPRQDFYNANENSFVAIENAWDQARLKQLAKIDDWMWQAKKIG